MCVLENPRLSKETNAPNDGLENNFRQPNLPKLCFIQATKCEDYVYNLVG